jgi:hypothetical protein
MIEDGDKIWTPVLQVYPLYSLELQIHGWKQRKKKDVDIAFNGAFKIKVIICYPHGIDTWDEVLQTNVQTLQQEEWVALHFSSKEKAEEHCMKLCQKYMNLKINDK